MSQEFYKKKSPSDQEGETSLNDVVGGPPNDSLLERRALKRIREYSSPDQLEDLHIWAARLRLRQVSIDDESAEVILGEALRDCSKRLEAKILSGLQSNHKSCGDFSQDVDFCSFDKIFFEFLKEEFGLTAEPWCGKLMTQLTDLTTSYKGQNPAWVTWVFWLDTDVTNTFAVYLAGCLWKNNVELEWRRSVQICSSPKICMNDIVDKLFDPKKTRGETPDTLDTFFTSKGEMAFKLPSLAPELLKFVMRGITKFHSLIAHKIFRWELQTCFDQWASGQRNYANIYVDGGFAEIARRLGYDDHSPAVSDVKDILIAQSQCYVSAPRYRCSSMILLEGAYKKGDGEVTSLRITLAGFFRPGFCLSLERGDDRRLVPILPLPGLFGSPNLHSGQARLHLVLLEFLSDNSDELVERGCVLIRPRDISLMADEACIEEHHVERTLHAWCEDCPESPAFLQRNGEDYTLSHHNKKALDFLLAQGQKRVDGKKGVFTKRWKRKPKS